MCVYESTDRVARALDSDSVEVSTLSKSLVDERELIQRFVKERGITGVTKPWKAGDSSRCLVANKKYRIAYSRMKKLERLNLMGTVSTVPTTLEGAS